MNPSHRTLYRSRDGLFFGVCRGIADYAELSPFWVRFGVILAALFTGLWPILLLYIAAAIFLKPAPTVSFTSEEDYDLYNAYVTDRKSALRSLRRRCQALDRRTRSLENIVTSPRYDWERRFHSDP